MTLFQALDMLNRTLGIVLTTYRVYIHSENDVVMERYMDLNMKASTNQVDTEMQIERMNVNIKNKEVHMHVEE